MSTTGRHDAVLVASTSPTPVLDAGSVPAGLTLLNRGDNGGSVYVQRGPTGAAGAVLLGPGGTVKWTDPQAVPYAYLQAAGAVETLVVSDTVQDYADPTVVGVAVATRLVASGLKLVQRLDVLFDGLVSPLAAAPARIDVSGYASVTVVLAVELGTAPGAPVQFFEPHCVTVAFFPDNDPASYGSNTRILNNVTANTPAVYDCPTVSPFMQIGGAKEYQNRPIHVTIYGSSNSVQRFGPRLEQQSVYQSGPARRAAFFNIFPCFIAFGGFNDGGVVFGQGAGTLQIDATGPGQLSYATQETALANPLSRVIAAPAVVTGAQMVRVVLPRQAVQFGWDPQDDSSSVTVRYFPD